MARIFYHTATGEIHGVHPGAFRGSLPADVDFIDVTEAADKIVWPDARGENYNKVAGGVLVPAGQLVATIGRPVVRAATNWSKAPMANMISV